MSKIFVLANFYPKNQKNKEVKETILAIHYEMQQYSHLYSLLKE
jgi:hypothetical protein